MRLLTRQRGRNFSVADFEAAAQRVVPRAIFDFYHGGAGQEVTLRMNRQAFADWMLVPRVLRDVSAASPRTTVLGRPSSLPMVVAPMGAVGFGCRHGDTALAAAAHEAGIPYCLSVVAGTSIEEIAEKAGPRRWFQVYPLKQRSLMMGLIDRAQAAGFEALVVTVDVPVGGKRLRDLRNDFSMPFRFTRRNLKDFASRPAWALDMLIRGLPGMPNLAALARAGAPLSDVASSVGEGFDNAFDWNALADVRRVWKGPLILKGILHAGDARRALSLGCDGIVVSNHGGRQLDTAMPGLRALPAIVDAVRDRLEVYVDGGVRTGEDILKALALGARAVLIGRPLIFGVCVSGQRGATEVIRLLAAELLQAQQLAGATDLTRLPADLVSHVAQPIHKTHLIEECVHESVHQAA